MLYVVGFAKDCGLTSPQTRTALACACALLAHLRDVAHPPTPDAFEAQLKSLLIPVTSASGTGDKLHPDHVQELVEFIARLVMDNITLWNVVLTQDQEQEKRTQVIALETTRIRRSMQTGVVTETEWLAARQAEREAKRAAEREAKRAKLAEEEAKEAEARAEALRRMEAEVEALKAQRPATLEEAVEIQVKIRVTEEKIKLTEELYEKEQGLRDQINQAVGITAGGA